MICHFYYTRDSNGNLYLSEPISNEQEISKCVPVKYTGVGEWGNTKNLRMSWIKIDPDTHRAVESKFYQDIIDLSDIPEPSWEDETPIDVYVNLTVHNISYSIED